MPAATPSFRLPYAPSYFAIYKPYGMLSQFSREQPDQRTLADLDFDFPRDVYPVGRLDADSEGLLLLTNDKGLTAKLLEPKNAHARTYCVQVEGAPTAAALERLRTGLLLQIDGRPFQALPAQARLLDEWPGLPDRQPPVRFRKTVPDAWLELTLTEGKNRQVRRMCAAVGFPVLRLVRVQIGQLTLNGLLPGEVRPLNSAHLDQVLSRTII